MNTLKTENIIARPMNALIRNEISLSHSLLLGSAREMHIQFSYSHIFILFKMESNNSQDFYERI